MYVIYTYIKEREITDAVAVVAAVFVFYCKHSITQCLIIESEIS